MAPEQWAICMFIRRWATDHKPSIRESGLSLSKYKNVMGIMKPEHRHLVWHGSHILYAPYIQEQTQRVAPQIEQAQEFKALNYVFFSFDTFIHKDWAVF